MNLHPAYVGLLLLAAVVDLGALVAIRSRRQRREGRYLLLMLGSLGVWALTYAIFWMGDAPSWKFFWLNMTYLGVLGVAPAYFLFAVHYTRRSHRPMPIPDGALFVLPAVLLVGLWTDPWHHLFFAGLRRPTDSTFFQGGPLFWLNVAYSYGLFLIATGLLLATARRQWVRGHRSQAYLLAGTLLLPFFINVLSLAGEFATDIDLTPLTFSVTGLVLLYSVINRQLLDLIPISHRAILENINAGYLLFDRQNRLLDFNAVARDMLAPYLSLESGMDGTHLLERLPLNGIRHALREYSQTTVPWTNNRFFDLTVLPVRSADGETLGRLYIWQDVSAHRQAQQQLETLNQALQDEIRSRKRAEQALQEMADRDGLTGIHNRRYLIQQLPTLLAAARRRGAALTVAFLDLDHFKLINDRYGHQAGDRALKSVAQFLQSFLRETDLLCRYGGEEFVIAMPDSTIEDMLPRLETARQQLKQLRLTSPKGEFHLSVSIGVAEFSRHADNVEDLLHCADDALYTAKRNGRDRIEVFGETTDRSHHTWETRRADLTEDAAGGRPSRRATGERSDAPA